MRALVVYFCMLSAVTPLAADAIISANWACGGMSGSAYITDSAYATYSDAKDACGGPNFRADAYASANYASMDAHWSGIYLQVTADALNTAWVDVPEAGLYSLSFRMSGATVRDGPGGGISFSVTGDGLDGHWYGPGGRWLPSIDETFTTAPIMLDEGAYRYTTDVRASVTTYDTGNWAIADMRIGASFLGLNQVATGSGDTEVPEPGTFILLGSALASLMLLRQRKRKTA